MLAFWIMVLPIPYATRAWSESPLIGEAHWVSHHEERLSFVDALDSLTAERLVLVWWAASVALLAWGELERRFAAARPRMSVGAMIRFLAIVVTSAGVWLHDLRPFFSFENVTTEIGSTAIDALIVAHTVAALVGGARDLRRAPAP